MKNFDFTDYRFLVASVMDIHDEFETNGRKPGAEHWANETRYYRPQMCELVCGRWCQLTGHDRDEFPFHSDFIVQVWLAFRKDDEKNKRITRGQILAWISST